MAQATIPVDLLNPGQVFACIGLLEAAHVLLGSAQGGFDWSEAPARFHLRSAGERSPVEVVLEFLAGAEVHAVAPRGSRNSTTAVETKVLGPEDAFPFPDPGSPATLPAVLERRFGKDGQVARLTLDYWGDTRRDNAKFWAGMGGYPGAAIARDALDRIRSCWHEAAIDPFNMESEQSSSFRFDWRRDYVPIDIGFSLNTHAGRIASVGYPFVEILAAAGLSNARPAYLTKLSYRYGVIGIAPRADGHTADLFEPMLLRAALGAVELPFPQRCFRMQLGWPGKVGQARAIQTVMEEAER